MFWGLFFILFGGLLLLDRWDMYHGGLLSKLLISGLIAWGAAILFNRTCCRIRVETRRTDDGGLSAGITAGTAVDDPPK